MLEELLEAPRFSFIGGRLFSSVRSSGNDHLILCDQVALDGGRQGGYPGTSMSPSMLAARVGSSRRWSVRPALVVATFLFVQGELATNAHPSEAAASSTFQVLAAPDGVFELRQGARVMARLPSFAVVPPGAPGSPSVEEVAAQGHKLVVVRGAAKEKGPPRAWVAALEGDAARPLWSGALGALDADGEVTRHLGASAEGLELYQTASRISRCDGEPVKLGWQRYDFAADRWVAVATKAAAASTPPIVARRISGPGHPRPKIAFPFTIASAPPEGASEADGARALVAPLAISDGDPETVWRERAGPGGGGILTARAAGSGFSITGLEVLPGDPSSAARWAQSARAKALTLIFGAGPGERFDVVLEDDGNLGPAERKRPFWIPLPHPIASSCVTVVPRELVRAGGSAAPSLAWAEIAVQTDFDGAEGGKRLVGTLVQADCASRVDDVVALGAAAAPELVAALAAKPPVAPNGRRCLLSALARVGAGDGAGLAAALPELLPEGLEAEDEHLLGQTLARQPAVAVPALQRLLEDATAAEPARTSAARLLGALEEPSAAAAIVAAVGNEPPGLRAQLRRLAATSRGGTAALRAALVDTAMTAGARRADLVFALGVAAGTRRQDPAETNASSALLAEIAVDAKNDFEVRARAVQALAAIASDPAVQTLAQVRAKGDIAPLRLLAAAGLAGIARPAVLPAVRAALDDGDPAVREAAAAGLGALRDKSAAGQLITAAKQEPWPQVRRAEVAALGRLCGNEAGELLLRAVERDVLDVRKVALAGLQACRDPRAGSLMLSVLRREAEAPPLRTQAALLLGQAGDRSAVPEMAAGLRRMAVQAQDDLAIEETALTTVDALARLGGPAAVEAILSLRTDPRPSFRRAVVQALGRACEAPQAAAALRAASGDADAGVATAAKTSLRRCEGNRRARGAAPNGEPRAEKP
jgi:HEAT repeat protein